MTNSFVIPPHSSFVLRFNHVINAWQVYTFLIGRKNPVWKWFTVSPETARWFARSFAAPVSVDETISA
jgi:hypothetical protein